MENETLTPEQVASATGGQVISGPSGQLISGPSGQVIDNTNLKAMSEKLENDEWEQAEEIPSNWFKFEKVGDFIKGTLTNKRFQTSKNPLFPNQWVYELKTANGSITKVGISEKKSFINDKMKYVAEGQVVIFKYTKDVEGAFKGKPAKSIDVRVLGLDADYQSAPVAEDSIDNVQFN